MYVKFDIDFWGRKMPEVGFLMTNYPNHILDDKQQAKLYRVIG